MEEERPNENASALPENSGIFALSAPWSLCGSKSYRGVSREVSRSIAYSAFVDQLSFRPGKIGIRRSWRRISMPFRIELTRWNGVP